MKSFSKNLLSLGMQVEKELEGFKNELDQISEVIKETESSFKEQKVGTFKILLDSHMEFDDEGLHSTEIHKFLGWDGDKLLYFIEDEDHEYNNPTPLLQTKIRVRKEVYDLLEGKAEIELVPCAVGTGKYLFRGLLRQS